MKTLLVTGGSGFFGKSILDAFARTKLDRFDIGRIVVVSRRATELRSVCPHLVRRAVELNDADIRSMDNLYDADLVIHAAASSNAVDYFIDPKSARETIERGTRNVLRLISNAKRRPKMVYVSSGAVYGKQPSGASRCTEWQEFKDEPDGARNEYAMGKRIAEQMVQDAAAKLALQVSVARCFAFAGEWLPRNRHFAIADFMDRALTGKEIVVNARHEVVRSYMYADDLVEWLLEICLAGTAECPIFNVGSDESVSIRKLARLIAGLQNVPGELPEPDAHAPPDIYVPDVTRARVELGLEVRVPLVRAVQLTLQGMANMRTAVKTIRNNSQGARCH